MAYGGLIFIPIVFFIPAPDIELWGWIGLSAIIHLLYQMSLTKMYEVNPLSYAYPIARGTGPLLVTVFSVLIFKDTITLLELLFIASLVLGIFLTIKTSDHPSKGVGTDNETNTLYPLLTGVMIAGYTLIDSHAVKISENLLTFIIWSGLAQSPLLLIIALRKRGFKILKQSLKVWRYGIPATLIAQTGYAFALTAYSFGNVGKIAALRETSILFAGLIGYFWLKEKVSAQKAMAFILIMSSAVALAVF
ncbi:EamA family transporter [Kordiimonas sp. SCSIO 12610]|nr:DMT family transporter [Kordiimonas sp. SCSIO 12610]UTW54938.1 EamA family transporter [Kordiimonas sp. SCSIO 12610]